MLKDYQYQPIYRSIECDLDQEFYIPSYKESNFLERGSGFFFSALAYNVN